MPESLPRPPDLTLMSDCPIIAHPPMPPKIPQVTLAMPCPTHSRLPRPRVSVNSSISVIVMSDSIRPTPARISEYGKMIQSVANENPGSSKSSHASRGSPPAIPTDAVSTDAIATAFSASVKGAIGPLDIGFASTFLGSEASTLARIAISLSCWADLTAAARELSTSMSLTVSTG